MDSPGRRESPAYPQTVKRAQRDPADRLETPDSMDYLGSQEQRVPMEFQDSRDVTEIRWVLSVSKGYI